MDILNLERRIMELIEENQILLGGNFIDSSTLLFEEAGLNSVSLIDLIMSLEEEFNITFDGKELEFTNFETIERISFIVEKKLFNN